MFSGPHRIYVSYSSTDRCATRFKTFSDYNDFVINRKKKKDGICAFTHSMHV